MTVMPFALRKAFFCSPGRALGGWAALAFVLGALTGSACTPPSCPEGPLLTSLIDHERWTPVASAEDPFEPAEGAEIFPCEERVMTVEQLGDRTSWSVITGTCNWATVSQPLPRELHEGDELRVEVFWFSQQDFPGAVATVGLATGDEIVLAHPVPVPGPGSLLDVTIRVPRDVPEGAPLCFHVGNHGTNSWNLLDVSLVEQPVRPEGCVESG